jgi:hypothetical protein
MKEVIGNMDGELSRYRVTQVYKINRIKENKGKIK